MSVYYNGKEVSEVVYGTGDTGKLNFKAIGYEDVPEPLKDGLEYAKEIKDNWDSSKTSMYNKFKNDTKLIFMPMVDTSNVTEMHYCFQNCSSLTFIPQLDTSKVKKMSSCFSGCSSLTTIPELDTSSVTDMFSCFSDCSNLTTIPQLDTSKVTDMRYYFQNCSALTAIPQLDTSSVTNMSNCFDGCSALTAIPELDTSSVTNMSSCFQYCSSLTEIPELDTSSVTTITSCFYRCSNLKRIEGISFKSMGSISSSPSFIFGYSSNTTSRYILIKDMGTNSKCTSINTIYAQVWGINSDEIPDARQSLIDSLLTYSFDRRAAGYSDCTIQLYSNVKAVLTEEEKAAIQAKGYIIS